MNFWTYSEAISPALVRLLARGKAYGRPLGTPGIAYRSSLPRALVESISQSTRWDGISLPDAKAFTRACCVDFCDTAQMRRITDYLRRDPSFRYLRVSPDWKDYYQPLLTTWRKSYGAVTPASDIWPPVRKLLIRLNHLTSL